MAILALGIDLAKDVFALHGVADAGHVELSGDDAHLVQHLAVPGSLEAEAGGREHARAPPPALAATSSPSS